MLRAEVSNGTAFALSKESRDLTRPLLHGRQSDEPSAGGEQDPPLPAPLIVRA